VKPPGPWLAQAHTIHRVVQVNIRRIIQLTVLLGLAFSALLAIPFSITGPKPRTNEPAW
jgi:hypothetical protein